MEIGGYDSMVLTKKHPSEILVVILEDLVKKWPTIRVDVNDESFTAGLLPKDFPDESGCVDVARDVEMQKHWELTGGTLMADGEGPVSFYYYRKSTDLYEITTVTPGDPELDPFSAWVCEIVNNACQNE